MDEENNNIDTGNTIMVGKKDAINYAFAILQSLQPYNYEKYNELKIQAIDSSLSKTEYVLGFFKSIWIEETKRERKKVVVPKEDGRSYTLDVIEITLKKHPKLRI